LKRIPSLVVVTILFLSIFSTITLQIKAEPSETSIKLYAGTTNPGIVWEYKGGSNWESITENPSSLGWSVTSLISYEGALYASTISDPDIYSSFGRVWKYKGSKTWESVSEGLEASQVTFLIMYKGELYAGTATPARLYKYNPATSSWSKVLEYAPWFGFRSAYIWGDWLYLGEWYWDRFARWNGITFQEFQPNYWGSCVYNFEEYEGALYAGTYIGRIYKITAEPPAAIAIWGPEPNYRYAWTLKSFKGYLYIGFDAGSAGVAPLYRYDGTWFIQVWSYVTATTNAHEGIISMANDGTYLYVGVGAQAVGYPTYMSGVGTGRVYRTLDGTTYELISSTLGTGVQVLYVPPLPDLAVVDVNPVQVIYGASTLVLGKPTLIKVEIKSTFLEYVTAKIKITWDGQYLYEDLTIPGSKISTFYLPSTQFIVFTETGKRSISVEIDPENLITESDETNNKRALDVLVKDTRGFSILYGFVRMDIDYLFANSETEFIRATYPVSPEEVTYTTQRYDWMCVPCWSVLQPADLLVDLATVRVLSGNDFAVGVIPNWCADKIIDNDVGKTFPWILNSAVIREGASATVAHEIGHCLGLWRPPGPEEYKAYPETGGRLASGYWVSQRKSMQGICFMGSYFGPSYDLYWICNEDYEQLLRELRINPSDPELLFVSGLIFRNGTIQLRPWYRITNGVPDLQPQPEAVGNYSVVCLDAQGQVLSEVWFNATFMDEFEATGFAFTIPYPNRTAEILITYENETIGHRIVSPNPPTVRVTYPNGGEIWGGLATHTITWEAYDPDADKLTYALMYSTDRGATWVPLAIHLTDTKYTWNTSDLPTGNNYLIRVIASDGINTGMDDSDNTFTILAGWTHATIDLDPDTLNLQSKGKWITAYIELPEGHDVSNINVSTVVLDETIPAELKPVAIGDYDGDGIHDLMVKFKRADVISYILANVNPTELFEERFMTITLIITGYLNDGTPFIGSDTIRVIRH
jgi:hypothetical protein